MNTPGSKLMDVLRSLPVNLINDALTEYDDAVEIKGASAIRNHGAYLYGVVKRYVSVHERAQQEGDAGLLPMGEEGLTPAVHIRLEQLVHSEFCSRQEMNEKVKSKIRMLSEKDALFALEELASVERHSIRNFGSYFMGILNRYMRGDHQSKIRPKLSDKPQQHQQHQQQQLTNTKFGAASFQPPSPQFGASNNQRFQPNSNNNSSRFASNTSSSARGENRFSTSSAAANNNSSNNNRRDSNNKFGNRNNIPSNHAMLPNSNNNINQQQQAQPWQQQHQQQQQPNNPPYAAPLMGGGGQQPTGGMMVNVNQPSNNSNMGGMMGGGGMMSGGGGNQPPMGVGSGMQHQSNSNFPSNNTSIYGPPLSQQQPQPFSSYQPFGGGGGMGGSSQSGYPSQQQQPPVGSYSQNPSQQQHQVGGGMYGQQQQQPPPPPQQQQQPPISYGGNHNAYGQPPQPISNAYGQQQQPPQSNNAFGQVTTNNSYGGPPNSFSIPGYTPSNITSGAPAYNMGGGAPPAETQQLSSYGPSFVSNPTQQPLPYPQQPGVGGGWNSSQQQAMPNPIGGAIDILGLADKAASAIQALGSSNIGSVGFANTAGQQQSRQHYTQSAHQQVSSSSYSPYNSGMGGQQQQPRPPPMQSTMMQQSQPYAHQQEQQQPMGAPQGDLMGQRRRTTAKIHELPMTVQYAVQVRYL